MSDLDLLRAYEPVVRFTQGEMFFPAAVDGYLEHASLWNRTRTQDSGEWTAVLLAEVGEVTADALPQVAVAAPDDILYLRFAQEPMQGLDYQRWRLQEKPQFHAPGRLSRVGLTSRLSAALFSASLLARGKVPGGTAAAAQRQYVAIQEKRPGFVYYGRVVRQGGYVILHYHFFYVMNDWRSSFFGVNDHEADWEQILIYLAETPDGDCKPQWIAFAAHDYTGDDLRRRWDDPEITKEGNHPVVYAGAGSHAAYFERGEYITQVAIEAMRPVLHGAYAFRRFWRDTLRQGDAEALIKIVEGLTTIPFIDYARGDGRAIGPGQADTWTPALIDDSVGWVDGYRGLWGLDTGDLLGGERAPAGPKYTRDGAVRQSWYDPLGWSGLNKVTPPAQTVARLETQIADLSEEAERLDVKIAEGRNNLGKLELEVESLQATAALRKLLEARTLDLSAQEREVAALTKRRVEIDEALEACRAYLARLIAGERGDPQAHVRHKSTPQPPSEARSGRIAEVWAAASTGILLLLGVVLLATGVASPFFQIVLVVGTVAVVEAILTRKLVKLLTNVTIVLAFLASLVLLYEFFWQVSLVAVAVLAVVLIIDNLRELTGH